MFGNVFPFAREGPVRSSLEHLGRLLDRNWSVLIYPEGDRYPGVMGPFKSGTGLIAVESNTPVVPIRVRMRKDGVFEGGGLFSRGTVDIHFGRPVTFPRGTDYLQATSQLEAAVKGLGEPVEDAPR